jgi:hypothetical protein
LNSWLVGLHEKYFRTSSNTKGGFSLISIAASVQCTEGQSVLKGQNQHHRVEPAAPLDRPSVGLSGPASTEQT